MREIKFRAWDKVNKIMQYSGIIWGDYDFPALSELNYGDNIYNLSNLMQYTGLKDKNGKEIFDGDIVELFGWGSQKSSDGYAVIGWDDDEIGWNFLAYYHKNNNYLIRINKPNYIQDRYEFRQAIENCIVIGNIYENPELLDNK